MSKHTPGPWHWDSDPVKGDPLERMRYRVTAAGKTVTQCYYSSSDQQAEWDARLIAAAPDLLEALRALLDPAINEDGEWYRDAHSKARAAIAKAEGK